MLRSIKKLASATTLLKMEQSLLRKSSATREAKLARVTKIHRPLFRYNRPSQIIDEGDLETLYQWIPGFFKASDPGLVYDFITNGMSFKTFVRVLQTYSGCPILILVQSMNKAVFGAFFDNEVKMFSSGFVGSSDNFVFKLKPVAKEYKTDWTKNDFFFYCTFEELTFGGGGQGPALSLLEGFERGRSMRSETYGNEPLHRIGKIWKRRDEFEILKVEVLVLY